MSIYDKALSLINASTTPKPSNKPSNKDVYDKVQEALKKRQKEIKDKVNIKKNMRLFGLPYQFRDKVDPRVSTVSDIIGRKYAENIVLDAPVITIIPGRPIYLAGDSNDGTTTGQKIIEAGSEDLSSLRAMIVTDKTKKKNSDQYYRYYDFQASYVEYMSYVNILCRTVASFLEIGDKIDGVDAQKYDWRNWHWSTDAEMGATALQKSLSKLKKSSSAWKQYMSVNQLTLTDKESKMKTKDIKNQAKAKLKDTTTTNDKKMDYTTTTEEEGIEVSIEEFFTSYNYIQFFVDVDSGASESMNNTTTESQLKGMIDSGSNMLKELAFVMNSGGIDASGMQKFLGETAQSLADQFSAGNKLTGVMNRIISLSSNVIKGENVIMPDIYQSSSYEKSYSFTVHLKTPYGNRLGFFMDIAVPLMHLIALGIPKQTTANTYGAPFLIKCYQEGAFVCNMGIVTGISVNKSATSWSTDGLPTEIDVTLQIADLYSDLSMSPQSSPLLFINNTSLIEYLAINCGLSLVTPNLTKKYNMILNTVQNAFHDVPDNIISEVGEAIDNFTLNFLGLKW